MKLTSTRMHTRIALAIFAAALAPTPASAFNFVDLGKAVVGHYQPGAHAVRAVAEHAGVGGAPAAPELPAATRDFGECASMFPGGKPPIVPGAERLRVRPLCFNGFAVLHSGVTKTPLYSVEVLTPTRLHAARGESRTDVFFSDARLPSDERAKLEDYVGSGFDRGHMSPAADMAGSLAMAQSFSLANMVPQAPENNRKAWADIEKATRKYVMRAQGPVYTITGPAFLPGECPSSAVAARPARANMTKCTIGNGVHVPSHLFKLVYDAGAGRAWAHWLANTNEARVGAPISYAELVRRTGINFLPGVQVSD